MLLSICIPTYNRAGFLDECLDSIAKSIRLSNKEVEVVISDNNSPDNTASVIDKYRKVINNIVYHKQLSTIFAEENFYFVAQQATGKYIWLIGDDDKIREDAVSKAFEQLEKEQPVVICNFSAHSATFSRIINTAQYSTDKVVVRDHNDMLAHFGTFLAFISGAIIEKRLFFSVEKREYDEYKQYGLSFFYTLCKAALNQKIGFVSEPIVELRTGNSGNYDWVKYMIIGYDEACKDLVKLGYKNEAVDQLKKTFIMKEVFWYILKLKADGVSTLYAFDELDKRYNGFSEYRFLCKPLKYLPSALFRQIKSMKRALVKS